MSALSTAPVYTYKFSFDGGLGLFKRLLGLQDFKGNTLLYIGESERKAILKLCDKNESCADVQHHKCTKDDV
jgi:hypothetical protein